MIFESRFWKDDLLRRADSLAKRKTQRRWSEASLAKVEQDLMLAAYSIRKLIESKKLSDSVASQTVPGRSFKPTDHGATRINWDRIEKLYDLSSSTAGTISAQHLVNQLIHSYVFMISLDERSLEGFYVSSDRDRNKRLLHIGIDAFLALLRSVGSDYPARVVRTWNENQQDYSVRAWSEEEAEAVTVRIVVSSCNGEERGAIVLEDSGKRE